MNLDKEQFKQKLSLIRSATSIKGKKYKSVQIVDENVVFVRENKVSFESVSINELYDLFTKEKNINTSIAKLYISGRVQSPAVAILSELKSDSIVNDIRKTENNYVKSFTEYKKSETLIDKIKDETKFFISLSELIGKNYLLSKSIGSPINSTHIFLSNNFRDYFFNQEINNCYLEILIALKSNKLFNSESLSHNIDGLILNHPVINNRIVEFDEEQHFTPALKDVLKYIVKILPDKYFKTQLDICNNLNYLNKSVLKKHRIKNELLNVPTSFIEFVEWLEFLGEKSTGYICNKNGFEFIGGRIAQRAYYDCLRDTAHLSKNNKFLKSPLRFAKKVFEDETKTQFSKISMSRIKEIIKDIFEKEYDLKI